MKASVIVKKLKVPLALDENNQWVAAENASKEKAYRCPSCLQTLVLRQGAKTVHHFSHPSNGCSQESILHKTAKYLIKEVCEELIGQGMPPTIMRACDSCNTRTPQSLENLQITSVVVEKKLASGFIADVALMIGENAVLAIEVKNTHGVDENKATNIGVPFVEVTAEEVIDSPMLLRPIQDTFSTVECAACEKALVKHWRYLEMLSQETKTWLPRNNLFRVAGFECWVETCKTEFLVFDWPGRSDGTPSPDKRPHTIQYRHSKTTHEDNWVNCCPSCQAFVGTFHWPSMCDETSDESLESYQRDITDVAIRFVGSGWPSYTDRALTMAGQNEDVLVLTPST